MKKTAYLTHNISLFSLFILGNAVINLPTKEANEFSFSAFILATAVSVLLFLLLSPLAEKIFKSGSSYTSTLKSVICGTVFFITAIFALFCAADTIKDFIAFAEEIILPDTHYFFTVIIFIGVAVFFARCRQEDFLKFCLLALILILILIVFFFFTAENYNIRNIFIFRLPEFSVLLKQSKPYFSNPVLPSLLLVAYNVLVFNKARKRVIVSGTVLGCAMLGLCILSTLLLFGAELAGGLDFPYAAAVSTITVGRLYTRMDGFSYFIYFACALIKTVVSWFVMYSCLEKLKKLKVSRKEHL